MMSDCTKSKSSIPTAKSTSVLSDCNPKLLHRSWESLHCNSPTLPISHSIGREYISLLLGAESCLYTVLLSRKLSSKRLIAVPITLTGLPRFHSAKENKLCLQSLTSTELSKDYLPHKQREHPHPDRAENFCLNINSVVSSNQKPWSRSLLRTPVFCFPAHHSSDCPDSLSPPSACQHLHEELVFTHSSAPPCHLWGKVTPKVAAIRDFMNFYPSSHTHSQVQKLTAHQKWNNTWTCQLYY